MFSYTLTRSKRKTVAILIKDGKLFVKAPHRADLKIIEEFLVRKEKWIVRKLSESEKRAASVADVFAFRRFLYLGKNLTVVWSNRKMFRLENGCLQIPDVYATNGTLVASEKFVVALKRFYARIAKEYLSERLRIIAERLGIAYTGFSLTSAKTKWGSCDSYNRIKLHGNLILLKPEWIDYVVVHELMHTKEHNHSKKFWGNVEKVLPEYKKTVLCLKEFGSLTEYLA